MEQNKRQLEEGIEMDQSIKRHRTGDNHLELGLLLMNRDVGLIIGKGGNNIKTIRNDSGARVNIPDHFPGSQERIAEISGVVEDVSQAIQMIASSLSEDRPEVCILAESKNLGSVIGKGGSIINKIRDDTQARIDIDKECLGNSTQKEIRISGDAKNVHNAIDIVVQHLADGTSPVRVPYVPHRGGGNLSFSPVRGRKGRGGRGRGGYGGFGGGPRSRGSRFMMQPGYGDVDMPYNGGSCSNFGRKRAPPSGLRIETIIMVPGDMIGKIIGRGGSHINAIRSESCATIVVSEGDGGASDRKITVTGETRSRGIACDMIESLVSNLQ